MSQLTFHILTLFPDSLKNAFNYSILARAQESKLITVNYLNIRDFAEDKHKTVDDSPYGGGRGMILKVDILVKALETIKPKPYGILLTASGKKYNQEKAISLSKKKNIAIICGHYEGIDARAEKYVDEQLSIGDFILTGGEIAAMAIVDSVTRLIPGAIKEESSQFESFSSPVILNKAKNLKPAKNKEYRSFVESSSTQDDRKEMNVLLEYPHYTRPENFRGQKVPKVLLSGNHQEIEKWRQKEAIKRTRKFRPDLLKAS